MLVVIQCATGGFHRGQRLVPDPAASNKWRISYPSIQIGPTHYDNASIAAYPRRALCGDDKPGTCKPLSLLF